MKLEIWPGPRVASLGRHKQFLAGHKNFVPPNSRVKTKNKKKGLHRRICEKSVLAHDFWGEDQKKKKTRKGKERFLLTNAGVMISKATKTKKPLKHNSTAKLSSI